MFARIRLGRAFKLSRVILVLSRLGSCQAFICCVSFSKP